ncbi:uncharacterized protein LOC129078369 [Pteronotus mesoamericanus]|uniref:uncharacterized protein LOC129078369 n=1 Tax=Pteronotus mesoamericanus TaxID=1884717 RepID=UPI0023EBD4B8|nr:uncharacterized protein LOC129078369 [Pteronotus parnellii mesoamericanus]
MQNSSLFARLGHLPPRPATETPPSPPFPHPAPTQTEVSPVVPKAQTARASTQVNLRNPADAERPFLAQPLPITAGRLRGLPAPGNPGETRPGMPAPATLRQLGDPLQGKPTTLSSDNPISEFGIGPWPS